MIELLIFPCPLPGDLRSIHDLKPWNLFDVLTEKYEWDPQDAKDFAAFLQPMLDFDPQNRATAAKCLQHPCVRAFHTSHC